MQEYSQGFNGVVYPISKENAKKFPHCDLEKHEIRDHFEPDSSFALIQFYSFKIAHILFPNNFIAVHGVRINPHQYFSEEANVPREHAIYSSHMVSFGGGFKFQEGLRACRCNSCLSHRELHANMIFDPKFQETVSRANQMGIYVPEDDTSDYCRTDKGNIIFFEIDEVDLEAIGIYLNSQPLSDQIRLARNFHSRLEQLNRQDAEDSFFSHLIRLG
jgi:hypothetical protein